MSNIGKSSTAALLIVVLVFTSSAALAGTLRDKQIERLIGDDFDSRRGCYIRKGKCRLTEEKSKDNLESLARGQCPGYGSQTLTLELPVTGSYTDTGNIAHYCPENSVYWVLHSQGGFSGPVSYWLGPFQIGKPDTSQKRRGTRRPLPSRRIGGPLTQKPTALKPGAVKKSSSYPSLKPGRKYPSQTQLKNPKPRISEEMSPPLWISNVISGE